MYQSIILKRNTIFNALLIALLGFAVVASSRGQDQPDDSAAPRTEMVEYFFVFLRRGPAWTSEVTPESSAVSQGHMANIDRLTESGQMVVAGPFVDEPGDDALTGLFILRADSIDEATSIVETDPGVVAGRFVFEILPWYGPKTLRY